MAIEVDEPTALPALQAAVAAGAEVEIDYFASSASEPGPRRVEPLQVVVREGRWYLDGLTAPTGGLRRFQVDRIQAVARTGSPARALADCSPAVRARLARPEAFLGGAEARPVTLAVAPRARFAVEALADGPIELRPDGWLQVTVLVGDATGWLGRLLLRLGANAELLGPPDLVAARADAATRALDRYSN